MTRKTSISLTDEQHAFADALVKEGQFPSLSAVLQSGVELLRQRRADEVADREAFRTFLRRRMEEPSISAEEFDRRVDTMLADKRREYGLDA